MMRHPVKAAVNQVTRVMGNKEYFGAIYNVYDIC